MVLKVSALIFTSFLDYIVGRYPWGICIFLLDSFFLPLVLSYTLTLECWWALTSLYTVSCKCFHLLVCLHIFSTTHLNTLMTSCAAWRNTSIPPYEIFVTPIHFHFIVLFLVKPTLGANLVIVFLYIL